MVDQPATIGALPVAVARAAGHQVTYLPGPAMRRIADLYPGRAKIDARDAVIIADAACSLPPHAAPSGRRRRSTSELDVLVGFDDDLAGEATRIANRIVACSPASTPRHRRQDQSPSRTWGILSRCGGSTGIAKAGRRKLTTIAKDPRTPHRRRTSLTRS